MIPRTWKSITLVSLGLSIVALLAVFAAGQTKCASAATGTCPASLVRTISQGLIANDDQADSDSRIETVNATDTLYIDASTDRVGFGTSAPASLVHVDGKITTGLATSSTGSIDILGTTSGNVTQTVAAAAGTWTFIWPTSAGTNTYALTTNGSGTSSWSQIGLTSAVTGVLPVANGGTNCSVASITCFNNITGLSAAGTTGTTTTNLVFATSPTLVTPVLGVASATSINKVAITAPATSATLTIADGKTGTFSNTLTFTGTDGSSAAFGTGGTVAYQGGTLAQFAATTSAQLAGVISDETGSGALVFGSAPSITTIDLTGGQITFPAVQAASAGANTLDDYEEGTWTPSLGGNTTYATQVGRYVKVGKTVYVEGQIQITTLGTGSATTMSGLPFTAQSSGFSGHFFVGYHSGLALNTISVLFQTAPGTATATFFDVAASGAGGNDGRALFGDGTRIYFSGTYEATN